MTRTIELAILRKIAIRVSESSDSLPASPITGFMAMVGKQYEGDLMVVGRAVNGWTRGWKPQEFKDNENLNAFIDGVFESVTIGQPCPMQWVSQCWGNYDHDYNTRKSAFWRVIRRVVDELEIADVGSSEWPSHLVWSNLYKFSPADGGNPSEALCTIQFDECKSLLQEEIHAYKPKRILCLTGVDWADPFIKAFAPEMAPISERRYVEAVGKLNAPHEPQSSIVVAAHPQTKKEDIWVREVVNSFEKC
jgi:hypothetical protein